MVFSIHVTLNVGGNLYLHCVYFTGMLDWQCKVVMVSKWIGNAENHIRV